MAGGSTDTLFVSDAEWYQPSTGGLARIDASSLVLSPVGQYDQLVGQRAELTGTGDGRLFGTPVCSHAESPRRTARYSPQSQAGLTGPLGSDDHRPWVGSAVRTLVLATLLLLPAAACSKPAGGTGGIAGGPDGAVDAAAATADGGVAQRIVFVLPPTSGNGFLGEVALVNLDGSGFRQLTNDGKPKFLPHFSPDGTKLLYTKYIAGDYGQAGSMENVAVFDLASGRETVVATVGPAAIAQASWSPDGKRIAYIELGVQTQGGLPGSPLMIIDADGSNAHVVGTPSGAPDDQFWADIAWSAQDWILFVVGQDVNGCSNSRTDKIRPDGSSRTKLSSGGTDCTPANASNPYGDADPGWSADGSTVFSSRGLPPPPQLGALRHVYAFSSDAWAPGKPETDLEASEPDCAVAVPKGSPDGKRVLGTRNCAPGGEDGVWVADVSSTATSNWLLVYHGGFGGDWNPLASQ